MAIAKALTVFDIYERAKVGPKVEEKEWDFKTIPQTASRLKQKYN
ncbi:monomethylamine:corrinoid methyltransferase, partial [Sporomusa sp. KB1]